MNIGSLRHRITIQSLVSSSNPFGSPDQWTDVATVWAAIQPMSSKEVFQAGQLAMKASHKITIRYPGANIAISAGNRVRYGSRVFQLQDGIVNAAERNISLDLTAYEIDPTQ